MGVKLLAWRGNDKKLSKKQVKQVSKIVNKSKKYKMYYESTVVTPALTANTWSTLWGQTTGFTNINQGDDSFQRQGDTIMCKHYKLTINSMGTSVITAGVNNFYYRVLVARLFGLYTGTPTDYFQNKAGGTTGSVEQFLVEKGTVLSDKVITFSYNTPQKLSLRLPMKSSKIPHTLIQFADDDVPANIEKNNVVVFGYILGSDDGPALQKLAITAEIGFYDKY